MTTRKARTQKHAAGPLKATSIAEWRRFREEGVLARLPISGLVVRLRPVSLSDLAANGEIPDHLTPLLDAVLADETDPNAIETVSDGLKEVNQLMEIVNPMVRAALLEPKLAPEGEPAGDDAIPIEYLPVQDRAQIFRWLAQEANTLELFRAQPAPDVAPVDTE